MPRWPVTPEIDEMLTIDPPPAFCITGIANFMPRKTPVALTAISRCQAAVSNRSSTALPSRGVEQIAARAAADSGIVDQDVELAERGHGRGDRGLPLGFAGHVEL